MATRIPMTREAISERFTPALETLEETLRQGRRTFVRGQHAAEDAATAYIRQRPLQTIAVAAAGGALAGAVIGCASGWLARGRRSF